MKHLLILVLLSFLFGCKKEVRQEIILSNKSSVNIFYCVHGDSIPEVSNVEIIRPWTDDKIKNHHRNLKFETKKDSLENVKSLRTAFLIKKDSQKVFFSSRAVGIFLDKESIQEQIRNEYAGCLYVFVIKEDDLASYSDVEILENGLLKLFISLKEFDVKQNRMEFQYF
ncbi:hypothetical protein MM239_01540 [Belliella sp. DSM 111904]|uniref:Lipoprotein n=1 Tax=Belliella filtrata TaxID=2923435 RepID=A0ABS9UV72_9BACT|nr:hypothetical protein [Belliella filtrata]MCH7408063.1 hypothetical protein [Belliella filtrata]